MLTFHSNIGEIDRKAWRDLAANSSTATWFQTPECYDFYASSNDLKPFAFGVSENENLVGIVCGYVVADGNWLQRYFSRRAIVPGGALLADSISAEAICKLLTGCKMAIKRQAIYLEFRNYNNFSAQKSLFITCGFCYRRHYDIFVDVSDENSLHKRISEEKKRQIRSANSCCQIVCDPSSQEIKSFHELLKTLYRNRVKRPLFSLDFFEKLSQNPNGKLLLIRHENEIVGGMALVVWQKTAYEWFICGNNSELHASSLATWAGLKFAHDSGCEKFDFMGAGEPNKPYGVRNFKLRFGGELHEFGRFLCVENRLLFAVGSFAMWLKDKIF